MKYRRAFTLIELLIVIAIVGTMAILVLDLALSFLRETAEAPTELTIEALVGQAREHALVQGKILTLYLNLEKREFGLRPYNPLWETSVDASLAKLSAQRNRIRETKPQNDEKDKEQSQKIAWIMPLHKLPANLIQIHSISGLTLAGPEIFLHFYPDGTSDSFILEFDREKNRYLYIPRQNTAPRYLNELRPAEETKP